MARGVNKVILVGNLGEILKLDIPRMEAPSPSSVLRPPIHGATSQQENNKIERNGTILFVSLGWLRLLVNI